MVKNQIAAGVLAPGSRLPSTRSLAAEWGISRTTVTSAYDQLIAEGYIVTHQGGRARVAHGLGGAVVRPSPSPHPSRQGRLSSFGMRFSAFSMPAVASTSDLKVDFRYGDLSAADFPVLAWKKAMTRTLLRQRERLEYGDPHGSLRLRSALQGYLWRGRGLRCTPEQIVVVNGSQQGLDLCARLLLDPGDPAIMEEPGYNLARQVFESAGAEILAIPVDHEGLQAQNLPPARLAYATPSHQYPLGAVMSAGRRRELLAWAHQCDAFIIEDDYDSEYRFDIHPIPPLQAMDDGGRVIYLSTFSKTLSPSLRLGYLVLPVELAEAFAKAKRLTDRHAPGFEQDTIADLIETGAYERHIRRVRRANAARRTALLYALETELGDAVTVTGADAGLHVVIWLDQIPRNKENAFATRARAAGLGLYPLSSLYASVPPKNHPNLAGFVMGYASLSEQHIEKGIKKLGEILRSLLVKPKPS